MFTRDELFEYFSGQYTEEQVVNALKKLAEADNSIDPDANEFPASITERLEQVFEIVEVAIASTKQLTGSSDLAQIEQTAINMATAQEIPITIDTVRGLIQILETEAIAEAVVIHEQRKRVRENALLQLEINSLAETNKEVSKRIEAIYKLCQDPETLDSILEEHGLLPACDAGKEYTELTASCSTDFDVDEYLKGKKKPRTVHDTKNLVKSLVTRSLR